MFFSIEGNFVLITFVNRNLLAIVSPPAFQERHHILVSMISVIHQESREKRYKRSGDLPNCHAMLLNSTASDTLRLSALGEHLH